MIALFLSMLDWMLIGINIGLYLESNNEYKIFNLIVAFCILPLAIQLTYKGCIEE